MAASGLGTVDSLANCPTSGTCLRPARSGKVPRPAIAGVRMRLPSARNATIDLLRGIAIGVVLLLHYTLAFRLSASPLADWLGKPLLRAITLNGNYGVTIFFVVSGFLITRNSLLRYGRLADMDLRRFYAQRFARLLPSLLLALAIVVALGCLGVPFFDNRDGGNSLPNSYFIVAVGSILTFWHNVLMQSAGYFNYCLNVYWSLSVEMMFYLAFPLLCVLLRRNVLIVAVGVALIAIGPWYRQQHADDEIFFMYGYWACFDAIAMGCLAAMLAQQWQPRAGFAAAMRPLAALALAAVYLVGIGGHEALGFTGIGLATAILMLVASDAPPGHWLASLPSRALRWLGSHSYEVYLFHIIVLAAMRNVTDKEHLAYEWKLPWLLVFVAASAAVAAAVARWIGQPSERWLRARLGGAGRRNAVSP
jgi:peptidoglycan/LPS O-acetylase OafA/YrhL